MNNCANPLASSRTNFSLHAIKWYALHTRPRAEKKVAQLLKALNIPFYLPLVTTVRQWSDRKKKVQVPLITSYIFVQVYEKELKPLYNVQHVLGILKYLGKPAIVHDYEINNLKILLNQKEDFSKVEPMSLRQGEQVEVINGAFIGLKGRYVHHKGKYRVLVNIIALQSAFIVDIPKMYIKKI